LKELMDEDISGIMNFFLKISGVVDDKTNNNNNRRPATAKWIDSERRRRRQRRRLGRIKCHAKPLAPLLAFDWEQPKARVIINVPKKEKKIKEKIFRANGGAPIASKKIKEKGGDGGIFFFSFFLGWRHHRVYMYVCINIFFFLEPKETRIKTFSLARFLQPHPHSPT
jgi:hypothetical protein